jgi:hypothetical protein
LYRSGAIPPPWTRHQEAQLHLNDATKLFRRLGVDVQSLSAEDFKLAYYRLARRYHPDLNPMATN